MSKTLSLFSALLCTFIWGTTFIAQDTGMDDIGPFTFNSVRFFVGFLAIIPLALLFEAKKLKKEFRNSLTDIYTGEKKKITPLDFIVKALNASLKKFQNFN